VIDKFDRHLSGYGGIIACDRALCELDEKQFCNHTDVVLVRLILLMQGN
jgi:hypothetical protein